ncbi:MAG: SDR family oxidoreductase [Actinobacteria bacterium]|nr:SDR family oxidoreductase [Actinomycetota bacterium]
MGYFVTGATGFIGGQLVERLLANRTGTIYCLVRDGSEGKLEERIKEWGTTKRRIKPVIGDLSEPKLGLPNARIKELKGDVDHVFHLAAVYDMTASDEALHEANVEGTRHVVEFVNAVQPRLFHHVSSIAAAGRFPGTFREDMFDEAEGLDANPYFRTKHESERIARDECDVPWRVYRPGIVIGDSRTGEIDKIDGPYYFFKLVQRLRDMLPQWFPLIGLEGRRINIVPVDFVVDALDHIAHLDEQRWDGKVFHLVDEDPYRAGQVINLFAEAAHGPRFQMRIDSAALDLIPKNAKKLMGSLPPVRNAKRAVLGDLGIPEDVLGYINWPTKYDRRNTAEALEGSGIEVPRLEDYAWRIWDHWERHLDPDLHKDRSLAGRIRDRIVIVTGASDGIGKEVALQAADAGAHVLLVSRTREKLEAVKAEIEEAGGTASVHPCDLSDMEDVARLADEIIDEHGRIDVLVNNAGRSIRRSVKLSYDRFHDYERTMQLNYFGAIRLILKLLPVMAKQESGGHIINVSSIGVQTNTPRFSAYVASKAALDAFSRCIASEVIDDGVHLTAVYMPLVRTKMIAPTKMYDYFPAISPEEAADMVCSAMIDRPKKVATGLGSFGEVAYAVAPKVVDQVLHMGYKMFPESSAAKGDDAKKGEDKASSEGLAFAHLLKGVHW